MNPQQTQAMAVVPAHPSAGRRAVPIWLLILFFLLLFWSMVYFDQHGGWFNRDVYYPYVSVKQVDEMWPKSSDDALFIQGKALFSQQCAVCHMENGVGKPANGCPPLVGSEWVKNPGPGRIVRIISKGLAGPLEVAGKQYGTGTMLPVGDGLPGSEAEKSQAIAAIASYVRKSFGGVTVALKPEQIQAVRAQIKDRNTSFTAAELLAIGEKD